MKDHKQELEGHDSIHKGGMTVPVEVKQMYVKKGDQLRIKIRLAGEMLERHGLATKLPAR
jgi:hypothetical protein